MCYIKTKDFSIDEAIKKIKSSNKSIGAIVTFIGYVRDFNKKTNDKLETLFIEHYEGMTEKSINNIISSAKKKWNLEDLCLFHRVGKLKVGEPIVLIVVASKHRDDAFSACQYIIDFLKIKAPFWKKEISKINSKWVDQKKSDYEKIQQ